MLNQAFVDYLVSGGKLAPGTIGRLAQVVEQTGESTVGTLIKLGHLSESAMAGALAEYLQLPQLSPADIPPSPLELPELDNRFLRAHAALPLALNEDCLSLAQWDPLDEFPVRAVEFACGTRVRRYVGARSQIEAAFASLYEVDDSGAPSAAQPAIPSDDEDLERLKDLASDAPVVQLVQKIISDAVGRKASDIHLEPTESRLKVRVRLDGMLHDVGHYPSDLRASIVSRIKIMASLNIAERRLPQDGRIRMTVQGKETDFRVATTPTVHGESVVLRILDRQEVSLDFQQLGFDDGQIEVLRSALASPYGIVLSTGPTGSGKTTTLYTALKELSTPDKKILTVEDPVEYTLEHINQTQVKPQIGYTFANALRAFLRQDPDILMVGEIRDRETAEIAVQAALTGHLLLSTLHTNSAAAAITRLLDMGIEDYLLTSTVHLIIGQRLVRKLCIHCREPYEAGTALLERIGMLSIDKTPTLYKPKGCAVCAHSGYQGRSSIVELFSMTEPMQRLVLARTDATALERAAVEAGMRTMLSDGVKKALAGLTTLEEVLRVTRSA